MDAVSCGLSHPDILLRRCMAQVHDSCQVRCIAVNMTADIYQHNVLVVHDPVRGIAVKGMVFVPARVDCKVRYFIHSPCRHSAGDPPGNVLFRGDTRPDLAECLHNGCFRHPPCGPDPVDFPWRLDHARPLDRRSAVRKYKVGKRIRQLLQNGQGPDIMLAVPCLQSHGLYLISQFSQELFHCVRRSL